MRKIEETHFVCLDCETTGLDPKEDRIIEIAIIRFTLREVLATFESLVDPERLIPQSSFEIHHISQEMVKGKPTIDLILPQLLEIIGNQIIVGHGIHFDVEILAQAADRAGIPHELRANKQLDTLRIARLYGGSPTNSLEQLRKHFNIPFEGAHRAMNDVIVNCDVFKYLIKQYKTVEQLFELLAKPIKMKIMPLGKHKGRALKELPLHYLMRAANMEYDPDLTYSIRSEIARRKKGNSFVQAGNPFHAL